MWMGWIVKRPEWFTSVLLALEGGCCDEALTLCNRSCSGDCRWSLVYKELVYSVLQCLLPTLAQPYGDGTGWVRCMYNKPRNTKLPEYGIRISLM